LGTGPGLDHVVVVVRDLEDAMRIYRDVLGFTVVRGGSFPGGVRNGAVRFGANYLELITVDPSQTAENKDASDLAGFLEKREGAILVGLAVSSAQQTADFLRARGYEISGPDSSAYTPEGSKEAQAALWQTVRFKKPVVPSDAIFFIQYAKPRPRTNGAEHQNSSIGIHSVWMAVKDLNAATRAYESIGLSAARTLKMTRLGANGREITAGQGVILLLHANDSKGSLASFVTKYGEGIVGVSIRVRDIDVARALLRATTSQDLSPYSGPNGKSILLPSQFTHGIWMELFQDERLTRTGPDGGR
jgi:catechol 2,3-dioxygenase-like lactoylglutathione lyase family enzyme